MARTLDAIVREQFGMQVMLIAQLQAQIEELREELEKLKAAAKEQELADGRDPR